MDALETIRRKGRQGITRISYGTNLPVDRAHNVVSFFLERGLVKHEDYGSSTCYSLTSRGGEFL